MKANVLLKLLLLCVWSGFMAASAQAVPINLNDFSFFLGDPVTIAPDGSSATIGELDGVSPVLLFNDPGAPIDPNPEVIIAGPGVSLIFDYNFVEGAEAMTNWVLSSWIRPVPARASVLNSLPKAPVPARFHSIYPG